MAMEVLHVMTPAEWGKPIDVDEKWIHFVDDNVKDSKSSPSSTIPCTFLLICSELPPG